MKKRISLILVFCLFVGTFALSPVTAEAATNKPSYDTEKYIKEAISAKLFPSSIGSRPYTDYMTNQEACTTLLQLYTFLGGAAVTVPAVHPFTNTQDADVEKAYELGLIPPSAYSAYYDDGEEEGEGGGYYYDTDEET
ncbi:MAG: hypothetical protein LBN35_01465, partial [Clostridiales Family XIII bacterium]|nr:hypothetical protein [Clostridiales Family XIII bacterium]